MNGPLVSVIVPTYNRRRLLEKCLASVFSQDISELGELQVIVVDDGSLDGTWEWLQQLKQEHPCLVPLRLGNVGVARARNEGMKAATGTYIRFLDSDDEMAPDSLVKLLKPALDSGCDLVTAAYYRKVAGTVSLKCLMKPAGLMSVQDYVGLFVRYATSYTVGVVWNKLFRRELILQGGISFQDHMNFGEDFAFVTDYMALCRSVWVITEPVNVYFFNPSSMTVKQVASCFTKPIANLRVKRVMMHHYKAMMMKLGTYDRYRWQVNTYMLRYNIHD